MDMDPQILVELTKIISEQNENPVRIEKNLVQKNPAKDKTGSYTVQLGSKYLTIHRPKNSQWSEAQQQKFSDQLDQMEQNKKLFYQRCEMEEPLVVPKSGISEDAINRIRGGASLTVNAFQQPVQIKPPHHELFGGEIRPPCQGTYGSSQSSLDGKRKLKSPVRAEEHERIQSLTKEERRNLPTLDDVIIQPEGRQELFVRYGQAKHKVRKHGAILGLPFTLTEDGRSVTEKTETNIKQFANEINDIVTSDSAVWFDKGRGRFQGHTERGYPAIHVYDKKEKIIVVFKADTREFVTVCRLNRKERIELITTGNFGGGKSGRVRNIPKDTNTNILNNSGTKNND